MLNMEEDQKTIQPVVKVRKDWDKAFEKMALSSDNKLLIVDIFDDENLKEWK
jgi:antitoxin MazE